MRPKQQTRLILDTSVLLRWWRRCRRGRQLADIRRGEIIQWGKKLTELHQTDAIATPVYIEMLAGTSDRRELAYTRIFLGCFRCIDEQRTPSTDWEEAIRLAGRIPREPRPRDLGDCLIRAIANRLKYGVITHDTGFAA
jgi:predicted nucleic acid-binding protein